MITFLSTIFVAIRFASRRLTLAVAWDDWSCLAALFFSYGFLITAAVLSRQDHGAGYPIHMLDKAEQERFFKVR